MTVFANGLEVACRKQGNKILAAFPDVCFTPPENPATPPGVPVPYPSFGLDSDTDKGTGSVKIGDETVSQKNLSYYSKTSGTDAGCAAKKGIVSSKNTGKAYDKAWSGNVKADGEPISRFTDLATTNTNGATNGAFSALVSSVGTSNGVAGPVKFTQCPCCKVVPAHDNQVDDEGNMLPTIKEADYYERGAQRVRTGLQNGVQAAQDALARVETQLANILIRAPARAPIVQGNVNAARGLLTQRQQELQNFNDRYDNLRNARNAADPCPNLHNPPDEGCGTHYDRTGEGVPPMPEPAELGYTEAFGQEFKRRYNRRHGTNTATGLGGHEQRNNHMTPLSAGGCPTGDGNLIPHQALSDDCKALDDFQSDLQG